MQNVIQKNINALTITFFVRENFSLYFQNEIQNNIYQATVKIGIKIEKRIFKTKIIQ